MMTFEDIREKVTHLVENLMLEEKDGVLNLGQERMMMLRAGSFGFLRKELVHTLGKDLARGTLKRYGFSSGFGDGHSLCRNFPGLSLEEQMHLGTLLHQREGIVRVETDVTLTRIDLERGVLELHSRWHDSVEAAEHLEHFGQAYEPACWSLSGYASGHLSYLLQRDVIALEKTCAAQGHAHCTFEVGYREEMVLRYPGCHDDYQSIDLVAMFDTLKDQVARQNALILGLKARSGAMAEAGPFDSMLGNSHALEKARHTARAVAGVDSTVLVTGESGTGKELMARAIHDASPRAEQPFVAVNCATLTESLQNAQLFGYVRGAFTGAADDRAGLFEAANGGTLFLDEVGELQPSAQGALLRVLQEGKISRVGETRERSIDVRLIAATHQNLERMVDGGRFRQDLFFRLNVVNIRMPSLRERDSDVLLLARYFLAGNAGRFNKQVEGFEPEVTRLFLDYHWPGNVRELQNAIERAVLLSTGPLITLADLPECLASNKQQDREEEIVQPIQQRLHYDERAAILAALQQSGGAKASAAKQLGISRATLWRKMKEYGLPSEKSYYAGKQ